MPRVNAIQTNFTAGEFSPKLLGRTDIARYNNAVSKLENCIPLIYGGAKNRDGTLFVKPAKFPNKVTVLVPFAYNVLQTYMLEFGDFYMRVFKNKAQIETSPGVPYEIVTPYSEAMLRKIDFQQSADTMFIENELIYPQRLRRFNDTAWDLNNAPITAEPYDEIGFTPNASLTLSSIAVGAGRVATSSTPQFEASDVGRYLFSGAGTAQITGFTNTSNVVINTTIAFTSVNVAAGSWTLDTSPQTSLTPSAANVVGTQINLTLAIGGWRSGDLNKYVKINGGLVKINGVSSNLVATGIIKVNLTSTTASPPLAWSLNSSIWGNGQGYPRTGLLHQQRLFLAGSTKRPQALAGSQTGGFLNFQLATNDDDAFLFNIAQSQDQIIHLTQVREMLSLGSGGLFSITGGVEKPITPTNIQVKSQSEDGTSDVRPVKIGNEIYYVSRSGKRLFSTNYNIQIDGFDVVDVSKVAEHLPQSGIVDMSYQKDPDSVLQLVLTNGRLATVTIDRSENVTGWASQVTDGIYESIATIPIDGAQQTWAVVKRTINGVDTRYIEVFEPGLKLDAAIMGVSALGADIWTGLNHLEGKSVSVLADGVVMGNFTVVAGQIQLPRSAKTVSIGLGYVSTIKLLPVEIVSQSGSSQGVNVRTGRCTIKFFESIGCTFNTEVIPFRKFGVGIFDKPVLPFTGVKKVDLLGWDDDNAGVVTIVQNQPLPMHVLSVTRKVTSND